MQNWNQKADRYIQDHRQKKRYAFLAIFMAFVVVFSVCGSLIIPAISATGDDTGEVTTSDSSETESNTLLGATSLGATYNKAFSSETKDSSYNFSSNITSAAVSYDKDSSGNVITETDADGNVYGQNVSFTIEYSSVSASGDSPVITTDNPCIYYALDSSIVITDYSGGIVYDTADGWTNRTDSSSSDTKESGDSESGIYYFVEIDGITYLVIQFRESYINYASTIQGKVVFTADVARANTADGDQTITFGSGSDATTVTIQFEDSAFYVAKAAEVVNESGTAKIKWTITITNEGQHKTLEGMTLSDLMLADATDVTFNPSGVATSNESGVYTFNSNADATGVETITVTYYTAIADSDLYSGSTISNTASLKDTGSTEVASDTTKLTLNNTSIQKSGAADYASSNSTVNGDINWTITVTNQYGTSLAGYSVADDAFSGAYSNLVVKDSSGNTIDSSKYTISDGKLKFGDDVTATSVTISYTSNITPSTSTETTVTNTAKVIYPGDIDGPSTTATVKYAKTSDLFNLSKTGSYDYDNEIITWTVTVKTDSTWYNYATLSGVTLTDSGFSGLTTSDITVSDNISYTLSGGTITIGDTKATSATFTYTQSVTDVASGTTEVTNTVGSNMESEDVTAKVDVTPRSEITKTLSGSTSETIYGKDVYSSSSDPKILTWTIDLIEDEGFVSGSETNILVDNLASTGDSGSHYMTADQISAITVKVKKASGDEWTTLDLTQNSTAYTVTPVYQDNDSEKPIIGFTISFGDAVTGYKYMQVSYSTTADVSSVEYGSTATFTNSASFDGGSAASPTYTFERKDPSSVGTMDLTVKKEWSGTTDYSDVSFTLQRKTGADGTWEDVTSDMITHFSDGTITLKADDGNNWSYTWSNLPAEVIDTSTGTSTAYYYRVVEDTTNFNALYWTQTYSDNSDGLNSTGAITVTNTYEEKFSKTAVDKNGNAITSISLDDLATVKIDDVEYYVVNWEISLPEPLNVTDTLPAGFQLCESSDVQIATWVSITIGSDGYYEQPAYVWSGSGYYIAANTSEYNKTNTYIYTKPTESSNGQIYFYASNSNSYVICYSTKIEAATLEDLVTQAVSSEAEGYTITNQYSGGEYTDCSTDLTITPSAEEDDSLLTKTGKGGTNNAVYTLLVNPTGATLSNDGTIDISDLISAKVDGELTDVNLSNIEIYELDTDGNRTGNMITDFSYRVEYMPEETSEEEVTYTISNGTTNGSSHQYYFSGWQAGDVVTFTLTKVDSDTLNSMYIYSGAGNVSMGDYSFDSEGKIVITYTIPSGTENFGISCWSNDTKYYVTATAVRTITTSLGSAAFYLTVPDETPMEITYTYKLASDLDAGTQVTFSNEATLETDNATSTDSADDVIISVSSSDAVSSTGSSPTLKKVNVGNENEALTASFTLMRWYNGTTQYATGFETSGDGVVKATGWSSSTDAATLKLDASTEQKFGEASEVLSNGTTPGKGNTDPTYPVIYCLTETAYPDGYQEANTTYYFTLSKEVTAYPDGVSASDVHTISSGGTIAIPNNKLITVSAKKTWDGSETLTDSTSWSVTFELYQSGTKSSSIPANAVAVSGVDTKTISNDSTDKTVSWDVLPNGADGKPIYYYVREISYTIDSTTYTYDSESGTYKDTSGNVGSYKPTYTGNALNDDGTVTVNNSSGLVIQKVWHNSDNTDMDSTKIPATAVQVTLKGKNSEGTWEEIATNLELTAANNWMLKVDETVYTNLSKYTSFSVEETGVKLNNSDTYETSSVALYGYTISSTSNVNGTSGTISLTNKDSTPTEVDVKVTKTWKDDLTSHDGVSVTLYQATEYGLDVGDLTDSLKMTDAAYTVTLSSENDWTYTWEDLPYKDESTNARYYYYAVETTELTGYETSYSMSVTSTLQTISITNYVPGTLTIEKTWVGETSASSISVDLYRRLETTEDTGTTSTVTVPNSLNVLALGDSITNGVGSGGPYTTLLQTLFDNSNDFSSVTVSNVSQSGLAIMNMPDGTYYTASSSFVNGANSTVYAETRSGLYQYIQNSAVSSKNPDIVLLMIGTNDIISHYTDYTKERYTTLLNEIKSQAPNAIIFVASIPDFDMSLGSVYTWFTRYAEYTGDQSTNQTALQTAINETYVANYNAMVKALAEETENVYFVDINSAVDAASQNGTVQVLDDGCHPNAVGYAAIASAFYDAINSYYYGETTSTSAPTNIDSVPDDITTNSAYTKVGTYTIKSSDNWKLTLSDLETTDSETGTAYVYYAVETSTGTAYEVSYTANGQTIDEDSATIQITNTRKSISLDLQKVWADGEDHTGETVTVQIYRSTSSSDAPESAQILTLDATTATVTTGYSTTIGATNTLTSATTSDSSTATAEITDGKVKITGLKVGTATITVSDGTSTKTISVTVSDAPTLQITPSTSTITAGNSATFTASLTDGTTISSLTITGDTSVATYYVNGTTITLTGVAEGTATFTATATDASGNTYTQTFGVTVTLPETFSVDSTCEVTEGKTTTLTISPNYGSFTVASSDTSIATATVSDGVITVTGVGTGTVTLTVTRTSASGDTVTQTVAVTVSEATASGTLVEITQQSPYYFYLSNTSTAVSKIELTFGEATVYGLNFNVYLDPYGFTNYDSNKLSYCYATYYCGAFTSLLTWDDGSYYFDATYSSNVLTFTAKADKATALGCVTIYPDSGVSTPVPVESIKVTYSDGTTESLTYTDNSNTLLTAATYSLANSYGGLLGAAQTSGELVETVELTYTNSGSDWQTTLSSLPAYDENGDAYYYWAVETAPGGYTAAYLFEDGDDATTYCISADRIYSDQNTGEITIENNQTEDSATTMPATGGSGNTWYVLIGSALTGSASAGLYYKARRKRHAKIS